MNVDVGLQSRSDGTDAGLDVTDQRFAIITPLVGLETWLWLLRTREWVGMARVRLTQSPSQNLTLLAFNNGAEWGAYVIDSVVQQH